MHSFKRLQEQAYDYLKEMILSGQFNGDEMYSESKTAAELGISRTPVRDALLRLTQEGYIDIYPSKGYKIRTANKTEIREICQIRGAIEGFCAYKLAQQNEMVKAQKIIKELKACLKEQEALLQSGEEDVSAFTEAETKFHNTIVGFVQNRQFSTLFHHYEYKMKELKYNVLQYHNRFSAALEEHTFIVSLIENGEAEKVYEYMISHALLTTYIGLQDLGVEVNALLPTSVLLGDFDEENSDNPVSSGMDHANEK